MQQNGSSDSMAASTTNTRLPHNASIVLAGDDDVLMGVSAPEDQEAVRSHDNKASMPEENHLPEQKQNPNHSFAEVVTEELSNSHDAEADAVFLLKIMTLGNLELINDMPTLEDLHNCPPTDPQLRDQTIKSLQQLQLSNQIIALGAALIPRTCALRRTCPIFPAYSQWYEENKTPVATIAVALRVAQIFLERGALDKETFYTAWGFVPYEDLPRFAKKLGEPDTNTPIASVDWHAWYELKRGLAQTRRPVL